VGLAALAAGTLPDAADRDVVSTAPRAAAAPTAPGAQAEHPPLPDPTETVVPPRPEVRSCTNPELGYALELPATWTVADDPDRPCRFFSSTGIGPPPDGSVLPVAEVRVLLAQVPFAELLAGLDDSVFEQVERREAVVAGAGAVVIRYEHPDDPGAGGYVAVLDRGPDPAVYVEAREQDSADFAATRRVLDAMLLSMEPA
jgi:hypothetical protein